MENSESASTSSNGSNSSHNKAPGSQLQQKNSALYSNSNNSINVNCNSTIASSITTNSTSNPMALFDFSPDLKKQVIFYNNNEKK